MALLSKSLSGCSQCLFLFNLFAVSQVYSCDPPHLWVINSCSILQKEPKEGIGLKDGCATNKQERTRLQVKSEPNINGVTAERAACENVDSAAV